MAKQLTEDLKKIDSKLQSELWVTNQVTFNPMLNIQLHTDASKDGLLAVFLYKHVDGVLKLIYQVSRLRQLKWTIIIL